MSLKKRWSALVLGSAVALTLGSIVPTAAYAAEETLPVAESVPTAEAVPSEAPTAAASAGYTLSGYLILPPGAAPQAAPMQLVNAALLRGPGTAGAVSRNATYDANTGAWTATNVPSGEYRIWFARDGHQLLPGKIQVTNHDQTGINIAVPAVGQVWLGFGLPAKASDSIESVVFRNTSTGKETSVAAKLNDLGLPTNPFTDLTSLGLCQAGGVGMRFWCPVLEPGQYTVHFKLGNGKTVYYNGHNGSNVANSNVAGTLSASQATKMQVSLLESVRLQPVDLSKHFDSAKPIPDATSGTFTDVPKSHKFYGDIKWLSDKKITTGVKQQDGTVKFLPRASVTREAMIAFLYRANGVKNYKPKGTSPFVDVKPGHQFYTQIMWAYETNVTTGIKLPGGKRKFAPKASITREAMAAFMYRQYGKQLPTGSAAAKFTDVPANHKFAKEIKWMASNKITTGAKKPGGSLKFMPKGATSREATAAFLHRAELKLR